MLEFNLVLQLLQQMSVYLVIAYLLSKTPLFLPVVQVTGNLPHKLACYFIFSCFCIMGTYFSLNVDGSIANTRTIGALLGSLLGGPVVGLLVGLTGGIHRFLLGGITADSCMITTIITGLIAGYVHYLLMKKGRIDLIYNPFIVASLAMAIEMLDIVLILLISKPFNIALSIVKSIGIPMIIANSLGAAMFMRILLDRKVIFEKYTSAFSTKVLKIAANTEGLLQEGFNKENNTKVADIIYQQLGVGAVSITDREKILAFIGIGADHHLPETPITSESTMQAIKDNQVKYLDGIRHPYQCSISKNCRLGSTLVIPLRGENNEVLGTIKLYEAKNRLFSSINRTLGEGIASLLSAQILAGQNERYKKLLVQTEIKLLHAQVNPHFLFNALNTLLAVIQHDQQQASELVRHLSTFFRKNLKRPQELVTLKDELDHITTYLEIEKMRFIDKLDIIIDVSETFSGAYLPAFSLQPIVENAIKHGISQIIGRGVITIRAYQREELLILEVEDNAGTYKEADKNTNGLGMNLVHKRIQIRYGETYGLSTKCQPNIYTKIILSLPLERTGN